ncbi:MAG TPA: phytanoyl-CoA dioxygenase family protein [Phenylobacterium sp.]|uniref:phytanoyl-CoA dioxygenase family protein n=1 Tax=Phenylobacterium sp. TaxID=1871053 RepID=UPI002C5A6296|nr:phytanoyl-CoA dioxygenase family protein [Phenylobacterium sp.]HSV04534.1 phytanoyl-CoA dioxygenase family protein [Phenylobacterium sp.]
MPSLSNRPPPGASLTREQRAQFLEEGVVRLPGLIPRRSVDAMAERLWADLAARYGALRDRRETWPDRAFQFRELRRAGAFAPLLSEGLAAVLDGFFGGRGWAPPPHPGLPLVTFPNTAEWSLPHQSWHLDIAPGVVLEPWPDHVRVFAFLAPAEPGGGGTLYVAGSHRASLLMMAQAPSRSWIRSAAVLGALKARSPWMAGLCAPGEPAERLRRFMAGGGALGEVRLRVGEMTGAPGDVILMHPGVVHAGAPNARATPRLMLAETIDAKA